MAIGEAACVSVHGANRLGSNSLIDLIVFGRAAGHRAAEVVKPGEAGRICPRTAPTPRLARLDRFRYANGGTSTAELRLQHAAGRCRRIARSIAPARRWPKARSYPRRLAGEATTSTSPTAR